MGRHPGPGGWLCSVSFCAAATVLAVSLISTGAFDSDFRLQYQAKLYSASSVPRWHPDRKIDKVLLSYVRRAGSTNIEKLLKRYVKDHPGVVTHSFIGSPDVMQQQISSAAAGEDLVTMINFRHPVERICSMYEYDFVGYHGRKYNSAVKVSIGNAVHSRNISLQLGVGPCPDEVVN